MQAESPGCRLCEPEAEVIVWQGKRCRVVLADTAGYPGFCRVVWQRHVREMTDLTPRDRSYLMSVIWAVEETLRELLAPDKINLASLGNLVPHLHWHVIPRFKDDVHFPDAVWAAARRRGVEHPVDFQRLAGALGERLERGR